MPVDRRYNLITLHPAKTGMTSITYLFDWLSLPLNKRPEFLVGFEPQHKQIFLGTLPLSYFPKYLKQNEDVKNFIKLIVVRNPYYRMVSHYLMMMKRDSTKETIPLRDFKITKKMIVKFNCFLKECNTILETTTMDELIKPGTNHKSHLIPQHKYIEFKDLSIKDFHVIKLDDLNTKLPIFLKETLGMDYNEKIPHKKNMSLKDVHYNQYYNSKTDDPEILHLCNQNKDLIIKMYAKDFEIFNFSNVI